MITKNVCAIVEQYTDKSTGKNRNKYIKVGVAFVHGDGNTTIKLEKWFNPMGLKGDCFLTIFDKDNNSQSAPKSQLDSPASWDDSSNGTDDAIPF